MHIVNSQELCGRQSSRRTVPLARLSDTALVILARDQDVGAFEELVARTEDRVYLLAMRYMRNPSDAQEVVQNSYLCAWRNLPTFQGRSQFGSWMYRITCNAALMLLRTRNRHPEIAINDIEPSELNEAIGHAAQKSITREDWSRRPDEELEFGQLRRRIEIAVNELPPELRTTFLLRDVWEMTTQETASKLGVSIPAAKTRLHRARRALRESLGDHAGC